MKAIKELTDWGTHSAHNHTYLVEGNTLVAYIKQGSTEAYYFKTPIKGFDQRGRKFEVVEPSPFRDWAELLRAHVKTQEAVPWIRKVKGSKPGVEYTVNTDEKTCTCSGFTFRGTCKHLKELDTVWLP